MSQTEDRFIPSTPAGKVEIEGSQAMLVFQRQLPHPPETVWAALTDPRQLEAWFVTSAKIEAGPGGSVEMISGPSNMHWTGRILTWDPPRVFEYEWKLTPLREVPNGEDTVVRWELARSGEQTILTLRHSRLSKATAIGFVQGTHAFLDRLQAYLDHAPLPDWMQRYAEVLPAYRPSSVPR